MSIFEVVDAGLAGIHYDINVGRLTITRQHMTAKPNKIVVFYSLSNAFDLISGSKFGEDIYPNI